MPPGKRTLESSQGSRARSPLPWHHRRSAGRAEGRQGAAGPAARPIILDGYLISHAGAPTALLAGSITRSYGLPSCCTWLRGDPASQFAPAAPSSSSCTACLGTPRRHRPRKGAIQGGRRSLTRRGRLVGAARAQCAAQAPAFPVSTPDPLPPFPAPRRPTSLEAEHSPASPRPASRPTAAGLPLGVAQRGGAANVRFPSEGGAAQREGGFAT